MTVPVVVQAKLAVDEVVDPAGVLISVTVGRVGSVGGGGGGGGGGCGEGGGGGGSAGGAGGAGADPESTGGAGVPSTSGAGRLTAKRYFAVALIPSAAYARNVKR